MMHINNGGPAFPCLRDVRHEQQFDNEEGMTLRQYAAIKLRVPHSGEEFIDEMIRASLRDQFAAVVMQSATATPSFMNFSSLDQLAEMSYAAARSMLKAREGGAV